MEQISRTSITEAVVDHFRRKIQTGELSPGDKLPSERELMKRLGVSRFSLREGLARLSALGIVTVQHGRGAFLCDDVKSQTLRDVLLPMLTNTDESRFLDLIEARIFLETTLASKAAQVRTEDEIELLRDNLDAAEAALDDSERFGEIDYEFHQIIAKMARNEFLWKMQEMLHGAIEEFISENVRDVQTRVEALQDHRKILEDIRKKASARVRENMQAHISCCVTNFRKKGKKAVRQETMNV